MIVLTQQKASIRRPTRVETYRSIRDSIIHGIARNRRITTYAYALVKATPPFENRIVKTFFCWFTIVLFFSNASDEGSLSGEPLASAANTNAIYVHR